MGAFAPAGQEEILGIWYDLEKWMWNMDDRRWYVLLKELYWIEREKEIVMKEVESLTQKLNYYTPLVTGSRKHKALINKLPDIMLAVKLLNRNTALT